MTGRIFTADHHVYDLPQPLAWTVTHTGSVPCDSYSMTVLYEADMAPVLRLAAGFAAIEAGQTVLRGIVDEYTVDLDEDGLRATIMGRGYAARLLDNESRPVTYQSATLEEIIRCHVTPYGITCDAVAPVWANSVYTVASGSSQWKALDNFCRTYGRVFTPLCPGRQTPGGARDPDQASGSWRRGSGAVLFLSGKPLRRADRGIGH